MNILYTVNDAFVPQLAAGMLSICENNEDADEIHFFVFSDGIEHSNQEAIADMLSPYGRDVSFIDIDGFMEKMGFDFDTSGWNEIVMSRLFVSSFLPDSIDRVLYLDGDTIVRHSLKDFWSADLKGNTIGAMPEPTADAKRMERLGIGGSVYFNAGVLLIDLSKWRENSIEQKVLACCKEKSELLFANDQDALNVVLCDSVCILPPTYNSCNSYWIYPYRFLCKLMPGFCSEDEYLTAKNDPTIVHYLGEERPWRKGNHHRFSSDYLLYLGKSPWRGAPQERGWEAYFFAWSLFNAAFRLFPGARYGLISEMIPLFMSYRKAKLNKQ